MQQRPQLTIEPLPLGGPHTVAGLPHEDDRGSFARLWSAAEFAGRGLASSLAEVSLSVTPKRGTLRGLHYQMSPHEEAKLVTCVRGEIWDVIVDLRKDSPTYRRWHGLRLSDDQHVALYVPEGFAHGFVTLTDDVLVLYHISHPYRSDASTGVRWNDPAFGIDWPLRPILIGARDKSFPDFPR